MAPNKQLALLTFSELESKRFNKNIYRAQVNNIDAKQLQKEIIEGESDILFLRIPSSKVEEIQKLDGLGMPYFQADTLVYYFADLNKYSPNPLRNDLQFVSITDKNFSEVKRLVSIIFKDYSNHYDANQYIEKFNIIEGYTEWVTGFSNNAGKVSWFVQSNGKNIGFATCSYNIEENISEGVLYGVDPEYSGGGVYTDIIRFSQGYMKSLGITNMKVSTQIQNYSVQKVWSREGFCMKESYSTIHVNSFYNYSVIPAVSFDINLSDDTNNTNQKKEINFAKINISSCLSECIETKFPADETEVLSSRYSFLRPVYPMQQYKVVITFPYIKGRIYLAVAKVFDIDNKLCIISYIDLIKK